MNNTERNLSANEKKVIGIAAMCHAMNREYCKLLGDYSQPIWEDAPGWQQESAINGVKMHLENPEATAEDSHKS